MQSRIMRPGSKSFSLKPGGNSADIMVRLIGWRPDQMQLVGLAASQLPLPAGCGWMTGPSRLRSTHSLPAGLASPAPHVDASAAPPPPLPPAGAQRQHRRAGGLPQQRTPAVMERLPRAPVRPGSGEGCCLYCRRCCCCTALLVPRPTTCNQPRSMTSHLCSTLCTCLPAAKAAHHLTAAQTLPAHPQSFSNQLYGLSRQTSVTSMGSALPVSPCGKLHAEPAVLRLAVAGLLCSVCDVALLCCLLLRGALHIPVRCHQPHRLNRRCCRAHFLPRRARAATAPQPTRRRCSARPAAPPAPAPRLRPSTSLWERTRRNWRLLAPPALSAAHK